MKLIRVVLSRGCLFGGVACVWLACGSNTTGGGGTAGSGGAGTGASNGVGGSTAGSGGSSSNGGGPSTGASTTGSSSTSGSGGIGGAAGGGGSGGIGGAAGGGGSGGTGGTAGSGGSGGTGGGASCAFSLDTNPCPVGQYCDSPGCHAQGTCVPQPTSAAMTRDPVCGCDKFNYWNAEVAAQRGASVSATGECAAPVTCGGFAARPCPGLFGSCSSKVPSGQLCSASEAVGACWALPDTCAAENAPQSRQCLSLSCNDACSLIRSEQRWYDDDTCPD
jgi:hypothetical protein